MFEREGFKFDFPTVRFIKNRWETETGRKVLEEVIQGVKDSVLVREILKYYILDHPENFDSYAHPIYPQDAIKDKEFWVLTGDDLRGIKVYSEDFSNTSEFSGKSLSYSMFINCQFNKADFSGPDLSYAQLEKCEFLDTTMISTQGFSTRFINCDMQNACLWKTSFIDTSFSGSNLSGVYFEDAFLEDMHLNYLTKLDRKLKSQWESRTLPAHQKVEILRSIRIGYEKAELWHIADRYLYSERTENRKHVIYPSCIVPPNPPNLLNIFHWTKDYLYSSISGYGTKPHRVIYVGLLISAIFALLYLLCGTPSNLSDFKPRVLEALYFSFTTFATFGFADITYGSDRIIMRLLSTAEAWIGAVTLSLFVAVLARKLLK
jgi:hypothetical protein